MQLPVTLTYLFNFNMIYVVLFALKISYSASDDYVVHPDEEKLSTKTWSKCDEFLNGAELNVKEIVDKPWKVFYFWNFVVDKTLKLTFKKAGSELVSRFKDVLEDRLVHPVNWSTAELVVHVSNDLGGLLVALNKAGLYRVVPSTKKKEPLSHIMRMAIKKVGEFYLAVMGCETRFAHLFSTDDKMPANNKEAEAAARLVNFKSNMGNSIYELEDFNFNDTANNEVQEPYESFETENKNKK